MTCEDFRRTLWDGLDEPGAAAADAAHEAACPACRSYARRAKRLEASLREPALEPSVDLSQAVLARLERPLPAPEGAAAFGGALAAGVLLAGALAYYGALWDARPWLDAWTHAAARSSTGQLIWAGAAALALWLTTHRPLWGGRHYEET